MSEKYIVTCAQVHGPRSHQEDRYFSEKFTAGKIQGRLLAVMDGHGGADVADFCAEKIDKLFPYENSIDPELALRKLVGSLSNKTIDFRSGSTLSAVCILENRNLASIAILGDSPVIVLDERGDVHQSPEHNVRSNLRERRAAEKRGGTFESGYIYNREGSFGLQMSRALGNVNLRGIVSHEPEIYTILAPRWILLASDGLMDPRHRDSGKLFKEISTLAGKHATADDLMQWAIARGLEDNATAVVWSADG